MGSTIFDARTLIAQPSNLGKFSSLCHLTQFGFLAQNIYSRFCFERPFCEWKRKNQHWR